MGSVQVQAPMQNGGIKLREEVHILLTLALPAVISTCSMQGMSVTDQMMVGHLGKEALAASAIGNTIFNLMIYFLLGFLTGVDTKAAQAHGANDKPTLISLCMAGMLTASLACMPMMGWLAASGSIAKYFFAQNDVISDLVSIFCVRLIPGVIPLVLSTTILKVLQAQNIMNLPAALNVISFFLNIYLNYFFIYYLGWGFVGTSLATTTTRVVQALFSAVLALWVRSDQLKTAHAENNEKEIHDLQWQSIWRSLLRGCDGSMIWRLSKLGVPGGCMMAMEVVSFNLTTALAGLLGIVEVDAHVVMMTIIAFNFVSFPFGIALAATIRIGNLLGQGKHHAAKLVSKLAVSLGAASMAVCAIVMFVLRNQLALLFIDDEDVRELVSQITLIACYCEIMDGIQGTAQGCLRGMGRQFELMVYNLLGFWLVGFASGTYLTFSLGIGLSGLWLGMLLGINTTAALNVHALLAVDWKAESDLALADNEADRALQQPLLSDADEADHDEPLEFDDAIDPSASIRARLNDPAAGGDIEAPDL